jgi:predicted nucleotide-binding protein (sugar kinase/HSP70/actin superfamily)
MNDGCSAGTGSFLEEAAASDMQVSIEKIGDVALGGSHPTAFGERCAAFINSEIRSALQQGAPHADVLAGLVYAITDNYLARVVGARRIGRTILLQGGVALNPALAPAVAARTGMKVLVPSNPELMGSVGAAQMAIDLLDANMAKEFKRKLESFGKVQMEVKRTFTCRTCENNCEIKKIALDEQVYPFGGLCSKWEMQRRPEELRQKEGEDLVSLRHDFMFQKFSPEPPIEPRGRIGIPLALSTHELYPLYAKLIVELGYEMVLSQPGKGNLQTYAPVCYPGEIMHAAVDDLIIQEVDYIFLPYLREFDVPEGHEHAYTCPVVQDTPGIIKSVFSKEANKILTPEIGLSNHLLSVSKKQIVGMAKRLGVSAKQAKKAWDSALDHQKNFETAYQKAVQDKLSQQHGPAVILVGRPYAAFASEVNLSVPRKIASRGFRVIPGDGLPFAPPKNKRDVWHFTQRVVAAIDYASNHEECYICVLSCFSCGPDAIIQHRIRHELEGTPFCFLEIDSHTAHAGIETRIGAFLDIIEERRRGSRQSSPEVETHKTNGNIRRKGKKTYVLDSEGQRLGLDHERVTHVLLADLPWITSEMFASFYSTLGWKAITTPDMNYETLQKARKVCSGRECLPFLAMMGKVVAYLESRPDDEFTIFHLLDQEGPCQNGSWYHIFPIIMKELGQENAVAAWPILPNHYLGGGEKAALILAAASIIGDLMCEVRSSLRCVAKNSEAALEKLDEQEQTLLEAGRKGLLAVDRQLRRSAKELAAIPLLRSPKGLPKVLLFGGIGRIFVDKPIQQFFEEKGILTKTNDISEFISLLESEWMERSGFAHGHIRPEEHYSLATIIGDLAFKSSRTKTFQAMHARVHCTAVEWLEKRWHGIMAESGLLFSHYTPFREVIQECHDMISRNSLTEAPCTLGRYFTCLKANAFDGYVNIGAFNCAPSNSASAVINILSKRINVPYATIEADGTVITPSQIRQLETVAAQCVRRAG